MKITFTGNTLRDYLTPIFRYKYIILTTFIVIMVSVIVGLEFKTPTYNAYTKILISAQKQTASPYYTGISSYHNAQIALTQSEIVNSTHVLERAVKVLQLDERPYDYEKNFCSPLKAWFMELRHKMSQSNSETVLLAPEEEQAYRMRMAVENLRENLSVEPIPDTDLFTICASDFDPNVAAMIANVVSRSYIIFDLEQQLAEMQIQYGEKYQTVIQLRDNINKMINKLTAQPISSLEAIGPASVKIVEQAQIPLTPAGGNKRVAIAVAFVMSIFLGILFTYGFEYMDQTFKTPKEVEDFFDLPLLGSIPKGTSTNGNLIKDIKNNNIKAPPYHRLSEQLYLLMNDKNMKSVLITASSYNDGSTSIVANTSVYLAKKGHKVLLIDANLRAPAIHEKFKISNSPGLADIFENKISFGETTQDIDHNLTILPAGKTTMNPMTILGSHKLPEIISAAKERYEIIFVDYPNLKNIKDVALLSSYLDGIVLVVNEGKTRRHTIKALISPLEQKNSNIIGVILNNRKYVIPQMIYERV
ncbi:MAG: polysaccharide biosynthesis tyrosine autokinase [Candidatus Kuenenia sp.]|nr:polysaccharide biosynthesis tyrosine autokinase [Candidatus Kuenenia hertensis]